MSEEGCSQFEQFQNLYLKYTTLQDRLKQTSDKESFIQLLVELGTESGFNFTAEDVEAAIQKYAESPKVAPPTVDSAIAQFKCRPEGFPWSDD
ncbi:MAG: Nif11-like leader peptide family natural product precursor [Coleofasciculus sp. S288]|nr:Nif11-like leader peptide family natural product precursor [Coleofasciculus sp. S288]